MHKKGLIMSNDGNNQVMQWILADIELYKKRRAGWERSLKGAPSEGILVAKSGISFCNTMIDTLEKRRMIIEGMMSSAVS